MKLYFTGYNPNLDNKVECFTNLVYNGFGNLEFQYTYTLLLSSDNSVLNIQRTQPQTIKLPDNLRVKQVSCADTKFVIVTDCGSIYKYDLILQKLSQLPNFLSFSDTEAGDKIVHIACGCAITVALSKFGKLFSSLNKLDFEHRNIVDVQVGNEHCLLLDGDGKVYSFGRGRYVTTFCGN